VSASAFVPVDTVLPAGNQIISEYLQLPSLFLPALEAKRSDNGLLSGTSGYDAWRRPGNGRAGVRDSGTLSGTSAEEERRQGCGHRASQTPSTVQGADLIVGQIIRDNPGLLHSGDILLLQAGGHIVTIAGSSGR
jgi:hypothetical protein